MLPIGALVRNIHYPAVGPGRILGSDRQGRLTIQLLWQQETPYAIDPANASLERYVLFGFAPVQFRVDGSEGFSTGHVIRQLDTDHKSLWRYELAVQSGGDWITTSVNETELVPLPPATNYPMEHLRTLAWQSPKRFFRRWKMLLIESRWLQDSGGIPAFLGARIHPMGHQLYAARRVLWDRVPRFILADEVGLGKTIEAGLIIQALKAEKPDLRVLVITPGSMARQWQTELYLRFGAQAYVHIDSSSLQKISKANWKDVLKSANLIVTATALQTFKEARQILTRQHWDLVIIDEAHQFPPGTEFYSFLHTLASTSYGLLALSATPSKREITSLAGLLALVSPEVYKPEDHDSLARGISIQRDVWDRLSFTSKYLQAAHNEGTSLKIEDLSYLAEQWEGLLPDDEIVMSLVSDLKSGRAAAADNLIAYVQEFHRLDHRIIRTRRITLEEAKHHWSERAFELIEYEPDSDEAVLANHLNEFPLHEESDPSQLALRGLYYRVFNSTPAFLLAFLKERQTSLSNGSYDSTLLDPIGLLTSDPGPADEELLIGQIIQTTSPLPGEANWLSIALGLTENWKEQRLVPARTRAVCKWLRHHLDESPKHQVIVFAQDSAVVVELTRDLQTVLPDIPVKSFHHRINESDLARIALQFQQNKDCRILVSDELGGEGRNFQNASALIHFDLPWSVSRIEQRIGRLDRVGRGADRPVNSIVLCGPSPMEQAIFAVHNGVFKVLTKSAGGIEYALPRFQRDLNQAICRGTEHVHELANSLSSQVEQELQNVDEAFELSLDASKLRLNEAHELAEWLNEESDLKEEDQTLAHWARKLGINTRRLRDDTWEFKWTDDELQRELKTLRPNGFMTGTFDRQRALTDDTQQFFSPGHPLVNALTADLHDSAEGRTSVMFLELGPKYRGRLYALILCRCTLDKSTLKEVNLSPGLMLRAQRFLWPEIQPTLFELHLDQTPSATLVTDASLTTALRSPTALSKHCKLVSPNTLNQGLDNVRSLWLAAGEAIALAIENVRELRKPITEKVSDRLAEDLRSEISYLNWLHQRQSETQAQRTIVEIEARKFLIDGVRREKINAEAVAVIVAS